MDTEQWRRHFVAQCVTGLDDACAIFNAEPDEYYAAVVEMGDYTMFGLYVNTQHHVDKKYGLFEADDRYERNTFEVHVSEFAKGEWKPFVRASEMASELVAACDEGEIEIDSYVDLIADAVVEAIARADIPQLLHTTYTGPLLLGIDFHDGGIEALDHQVSASANLNSEEWHQKVLKHAATSKYWMTRRQP